MTIEQYHAIQKPRDVVDNGEMSVPSIRPSFSPTDPRAVLMQPDMDDDHSPYLPATINHVLRSDSEDSSDAEEVLEMTRL